MKKVGMILLMCLLMTGCAAKETFETISDVYDIPAMAAPGQLMLSLPENAVMMTMADTEDRKLYLCDGYSVTTQILEGGDIERTFRHATGFEKDSLTVIETRQDDCKRYDCAWSAVGEGGDQVFRCVILDDGQQHYTVTLCTEASIAGELTGIWSDISNSATVINTG